MKNGISSKKKKDLIFYCAILFFPLLQFTIFYIYVNANSVLLAFQEYKSVLDGGGGFQYLQFNNLFANFTKVLQAFFGSEAQRDITTLHVLKNSFIAFSAQVGLVLPLSILFSYYIFKKGAMHGVFRIALFMPQIISSIIMCLMFRYLANNVYAGIVTKLTGNTRVTGLLNNTETIFPTLIFYQTWISFGTNVLLFSGAMSGINESILEAGKIDGASAIREFFNIVFPLTFSTLRVFVTLMLANLFMNQLNLYSFFGGSNAEPKFYTMGYYLYHETIVARTGGGANYPYISALGLLITLFIAPITMTIDSLLKKHGPSVD